MTKGRSALRQPTGPWEFLLGVLALLSISIFIIPYLGAIHLAVPGWLVPYVIPIDIGICAVFITDYLFRMGMHGKPLTFARENFLQPLAMIPLSTPIISSVQTILLLILLARFVRAFNVVFGQSAFQAVIRRYSGVLARELSDAVLLRSLATARDLTKRGRFAKWVADALDRRRPELHMIVKDSLHKVPAWDTFMRVPGADEIVSKAENLMVDALIETMRSERLNILIANVIDDSIEEFTLALEKKHPELAVDALGPDSQGRAYAN